MKRRKRRPDRYCMACGTAVRCWRNFCTLKCHIAYMASPAAWEERFWAKVRKSDGCWEWTASRFHNNYGRFTLNLQSKQAHRYSWELRNGPIPQGLIICHKCDNPPCVRPDHLFLGTHADNTADKMAKGRHRPRRAALASQPQEEKP